MTCIALKTRVLLQTIQLYLDGNEEPKKNPNFCSKENRLPLFIFFFDGDSISPLHWITKTCAQRFSSSIGVSQHGRGACTSVPYKKRPSQTSVISLALRKTLMDPQIAHSPASLRPRGRKNKTASRNIQKGTLRHQKNASPLRTFFFFFVFWITTAYSPLTLCFIIAFFSVGSFLFYTCKQHASKPTIPPNISLHKTFY